MTCLWKFSTIFNTSASSYHSLEHAKEKLIIASNRLIRLSKTQPAHPSEQNIRWSTPLSSPSCSTLANHWHCIEKSCKISNVFNWPNSGRSLISNSRTDSSRHLYSEVVNGKRHRGDVKRKLKDQLKSSLLQAGNRPNTWETEVTDHPSRWIAIYFGCSTERLRRK